MNKGQVAQIVLWGGGIMASAAFAFSGFVNGKVTALEEKNTVVVQRLSVTETQSAQYKDDIKEIRLLLKEINNKIK